MCITCIYLHISRVLNPGESFWRPAALYDMCPNNTSRGEGNGTPIQYSCLANPRDGGAWWAAVYGVIQSWTRQKRLSSSSSSSSTSRFHFCNIDHSPETVPPPTMFLQVSAPNLISGSSTFEEFFGLLLINSLTDDPPVKCRYSSFMFTAALDSRVGGGSKQNPLMPVTHPLGGDKLGARHRMTFWHKGVQM